MHNDRTFASELFAPLSLKSPPHSSLQRIHGCSGGVGKFEQLLKPVAPPLAPSSATNYRRSGISYTSAMSLLHKHGNMQSADPTSDRILSLPH